MQVLGLSIRFLILEWMVLPFVLMAAPFVAKVLWENVASCLIFMITCVRAEIVGP